MKHRTIGNCGKLEQECLKLYEMGIPCPQFATLDSGADDLSNPNNCVYYQQYVDQMIAEDMRPYGL